MNPEARANLDVVGPGQRGTVSNQPYTHEITKDRLLADLKVVVADAESLIREAAASSAEGYAVLRVRVEEKLAEARAVLGQAKTAVGEKAKLATDATHSYVKENPWKSAGIAAVAAAIVGFLLGRR